MAIKTTGDRVMEILLIGGGIIAIILFAIAIVIGPIGSEATENYFKIVKQFPGYNIVYHLTTKVMYIHSLETHSFTQLVNTDGSPMIWKE